MNRLVELDRKFKAIIGPDEHALGRLWDEVVRKLAVLEPYLAELEAENERLREIILADPEHPFRKWCEQEEVGGTVPSSWYLALKVENERLREDIHKVMLLADGMSHDLAHREPEGARQLAIVGSRLEAALADQEQHDG